MAKRRLLICSIARNARASLDRWMSQIVRLEALIRDEYSVTLACAENDSTDGTDEWLRNTAKDPTTLGIPFPMLVSTERLGTQQYGSVWNEARIRQLAAARNRCLDSAAPLDYDKIAYVEPDVSYDPSWVKELILARHPAAAGLGEPDVYSGWSLRTERNPKEAQFLYDVAATRATCYDACWDVNEDGGKWRGRSVIPTDLGGADAMCLHQVWSTFNCFAVYNAAPFKKGNPVGCYPEGLRWSHINKRHNASGIWIDDGDYGSGYLDCDTSVICEDLHDRGHHGIYLNTNCLIRHD